ncbi:alpha/beta hydrolase [Kutzneria chonburiensis]|uniref:Alpha/beta hydrolase n=1 Tax=Kutzneria chonburiensis TaxID=1483604 RepID=A0ABV6MM86_9PSEU|nr:alpha/beta hydrolase [Kutzneria chonburiensis]
MSLSGVALVLAAVASLTVGGTGQPGVTWHGCALGTDDAIGQELDSKGAQCADITVPMDYRQPNGRTMSVAISRIKAKDPAHRRGVLLMNPGGPGDSGLELAVLGDFAPALGAAYDLVGFDPRFVGRSGPVLCPWRTVTFQQSAGPNLASYQESVAFEAGLAAQCARGHRDELPYASTRNVARDMDAIRKALGEQRISYYGNSYGTYLGSVYLQMFGARADRFVLDSSVDPALFGAGFFVTQGPALEAALRHFAEWAAGKQGIGDTADEVVTTVRRLGPVRAGGYTVDSHVLPYLLYNGIRSDATDDYVEFATEIRQLRDGAPKVTDRLAAELSAIYIGGGENGARSGTAVFCADRAVSRDPATYFRDIQAHRTDEPVFGSVTRNITPCAFWPVQPIEPLTDVHNGLPVLLVAASNDPVAPYPGQLAMHRALTGSRLVTQEGAYHHGVFLGNSCIDAAVVGYLTGRPLPSVDGTC